MHYNFAAESFHTKKLCSRLSSRKPNFYAENEKSLLSPPLGLGATYDVHHWKARRRLPISHNWTFFARCFRFVTIRAFDRQTDRHNLDSNNVRMLRSRTIKSKIMSLMTSFYCFSVHAQLHRWWFHLKDSGFGLESCGLGSRSRTYWTRLRHCSLGVKWSHYLIGSPCLLRVAVAHINRIIHKTNTR